MLRRLDPYGFAESGSNSVAPEISIKTRLIGEYGREEGRKHQTFGVRN